MSDLIALFIVAIVAVTLVGVVLIDMFSSVKGVGEQTVESDERIERENDILMSRMIDYSENTNQ